MSLQLFKPGMASSESEAEAVFLGEISLPKPPSRIPDLLEIKSIVITDLSTSLTAEAHLFCEVIHTCFARLTHIRSSWRESPSVKRALAIEHGMMSSQRHTRENKNCSELLSKKTVHVRRVAHRASSELHWNIKPFHVSIVCLTFSSESR